MLYFDPRATPNRQSTTIITNCNGNMNLHAPSLVEYVRRTWNRSALAGEASRLTELWFHDGFSPHRNLRCQAPAKV